MGIRKTTEYEIYLKGDGNVTDLRDAVTELESGVIYALKEHVTAAEIVREYGTVRLIVRTKLDDE